MQTAADKLAAALAMHRQGQLDGAAAIYVEILQSQPRHFDALQLLAKIAAQRNSHDAAVELYARALQVKPDNVDALIHRGNALRELNRPEEALESYARVLAIAPNHLEAMNNRGNALRDLKRAEEALEIYDRALKLAPDSVAVLNNRGNALSDLKRFQEALESYDRALRAMPDHAGLLNRRGIALQDLKRPEEALRSFERAIALDPDSAEAHFNRGSALSALKRPEQALASYEQAIALDADYPEAFLERGNALRDMMQIDAALASFERAIALRPDYAEACVNQAYLLILRGDFARGWALHEWRWQREDYRPFIRNFSEPLWLGAEALAGKTVLLHAEQGLGDTLQFCRYALLAEAQGAKVIVAAAATQVELLQTLSPRITVIGGGTALPAFDCHCPMMSLPLAFKTRLDTIPTPTAYLSVPHAKRALWAGRLGPATRPRVGLVWSGNPKHTNDGNRSIDPELLRPLLESQAEFHCLQNEIRDVDRTALAALPAIRLWDNDIVDFSDTAALASLMDVIVSVDTAVAHLAAALGMPTWIMLPFIPDYRWLLDREDSPWYASVRLFRQTAAGDWRDPVARVAHELTRL